MKLYHATNQENTADITEIGLYPNSTDNPTRPVSNCETLQGQNLTGVYGWVSLEDAIEFAKYECGGDGVVFEFYANDCINDPEFDGAKFAIADEPIPARLIWEQWN